MLQKLQVAVPTIAEEHLVPRIASTASSDDILSLL